MADVDLTQAEADALIAMPKTRVDNNRWDYPGMGGSISVPVVSSDKRESFLLDISRGHIDLSRGKYQNRARQIVVLVRLDFGGPPHRNPDDTEVGCPHLHIYRQGFGDKWAMPLPQDSFRNPGDPWQTLEDFMCYCNIIDAPIIQRGYTA